MKRLLDLPHADARALLETGAPVFLTVNPVEYHGPHLSLHNDRLVSQGLVRDLHARLEARHPEWPLVVADDLEVGVDPCAGRGTRRGAFQRTQEIILESCRSLVQLGAKRVVLMTFHGAPLHSVALEGGVELLTSAGVKAVAPFNLVLEELLTLDLAQYAGALAHVPETERDAVLRDLRWDFHAGFMETSVALHYAPDSVSAVHRTLPPCPDIAPLTPFAVASRAARKLGRNRLADELKLASMGAGWSALRPFPGYTGRPDLATAASGAFFAKAMVDRMAPVVEDVLDGRARSPKPVLSWVRAATLNGRLSGLEAPSLKQMREFV